MHTVSSLHSVVACSKSALDNADDMFALNTAQK